MYRPDLRGSQRGVALITAMLLTAVATTAAVTMASRQHVDIRRSSNLFENDQALLFAAGVEAWAGQILVRDRQDGQVDHENEDWATILPPISVEGGLVAGRIEDLQGRFNINNLVRDGKASETDVAVFKRLLEILDLEPALADRVVDWLDTDENVTFPSGAEDNRYLGLEVPYRTANRLMASPSELMLVEGIKMEEYQKLSPYITVLPERTAVNVNTARAEVLMALIDGLTEADAERLISDRGDEGYASVAAFTASKLVRDRLDQARKKQGQTTGKRQNENGLEESLLSVGSDYFLVSASSSFGRAEKNINSVIKRSDTEASVIMRARGEL